MNNSQYTAFNIFSIIAAYIIATLGTIILLGYDFSYGVFFNLWADTLQPLSKGISINPNQELMIITGGSIGLGLLMAIFNPFPKSVRYGDARWAGKRDLKKMGLLEKEGMILGLWKGKLLRSKDYLSVMFIAPPNSRKSTGLMIPNLLSCGDTIIAYDVKFDLFNETSKRRGEFSEVLRFSPALKDSCCFNPLALKIIGEDWDDIVADVERLSTIIYPDPIKGGDTHWIEGARIVFTFFALKNIRENKETSIPLIRSTALETSAFALEDDDGEIIAEGTKGWLASFLDENEDDLPEQILLRGNDLLGRPEKEFGSVFGTFTTALNGFADSRCGRAFSSCDFSPQSLREKRTTLYVCVSDKDSKRFSTPIRILLETLNSYFLSTKPKAKHFGVLNLLDEFPRLGKMDVIMDAPALQRSNRIRTIFCAQAESQITEIYGKEKLETVKSSCAFNIFTAQTDDVLNEKISKNTGNFTDIKTTESKSNGKISTSKSEEKKPLILPQEVGSLPPGEMILHVQGFRDRPIRGQLALFYKNEVMKKMTGCTQEKIE
ncbi:MAG: hypothetical protein COC22_00225 [Flavobacteriaceae bacterium]|nr:MAG: hypothetical protein COC22_00225 [Flavobacteriaceae bacterium]